MLTSGLHFPQVNNLGSWKLAISVHFWVPILLNGVAVWDVAVMTSAQVPASSFSIPRITFCNNTVLLSGKCPHPTPRVSPVQKEPPRHSDFLTQIQRRSVLVRKTHALGDTGMY